MTSGSLPITCDWSKYVTSDKISSDGEDIGSSVGAETLSPVSVLQATNAPTKTINKSARTNILKFL